MAETTKCAHEPCSCAVQNDDKYCSPQCETLAESDNISIKCECAHAGC